MLKEVDFQLKAQILGTVIFTICSKIAKRRAPIHILDFLVNQDSKVNRASLIISTFQSRKIEVKTHNSFKKEQHSIKIMM
jgi:hypothetical protein